MKKLLVTVAIAVLSTMMIFSPAKAINLNQILKDLGQLAPLVLSDAKVGNLLSNGLEDKYRLSSNAEYQNRLQRVSTDVISKMQGLDTNYQFFCLASNDFNAFSCYGGKIYATEGLMRETQNSDAELSAVLRHEIAHNKMGHNKKALKTFKTTYAIQLAGLNKNLPQLLKSAAEAMLAKRSRGFEIDADKFSAENAISASDLRGNIAVFRRIEAEHKLEQEKYGNDITKQAYARLFATHPEPSLRAELAEDALFQKEYGSTFKAIAGASTFTSPTHSNYTGDLPIVIAHHGQWSSPCRTPEYANAYGFFNPMSLLKETAELKTYCDCLNKGYALAVTGDNDSHYPAEVATNYGFTYIDSHDNSPESLIQAIKDGRTYASATGTKITNENFRLDREYTKTDKVVLTFTLELPISFVLAPKVQVIRNGKVVATLEKENSKLERRPVYRFEDKPGVGKYWYVLYIPSELLTSPISFDVVDSATTSSSSSAIWQKGLVHGHSTYSDGISTIGDVWREAQATKLDFVFMTDHAEQFTDANKYNRYVGDCSAQSEALIPGVEYPMDETKQLRHLLVLGLYNYLSYKQMAEEKFFGVTNNASKTLIIQGPFHLGDDIPGSEIIKEATFDYSPTNSTVKLRVKGTPRKDPILWINHHEIGRIVTTDDKWHWYEFNVPTEFLQNGRNLFYIEAFIPNRWQSFDDCEVADVYILPQ